jgi:excisionase family DNA binding protein
LFTTQEFADLFRVTQHQVRSWVNSNKVTSIRTPGGHIRIAYDRDLIGSQVQESQQKETATA